MIEVQAQDLSEPGGIRIQAGLCVTKCLQDRVDSIHLFRIEYLVNRTCVQ